MSDATTTTETLRANVDRAARVYEAARDRFERYALAGNRSHVPMPPSALAEFVAAVQALAAAHDALAAVEGA